MPSDQLSLATGKDGREDVPAPSSVVIEKFIRLRDEWKSSRGHAASADALAVHPSYQKIIGLGPAVVPLLLRELEQAPDFWFWALRALTEADPVPAEARGNVRKMATAWLAWAKTQGYQW